MIDDATLIGAFTSLTNNFYLLFGFIAIGFAAIVWTQYQADRNLQTALATILASDKGLTKRVKKFTDRDEEVKQ